MAKSVIDKLLALEADAIAAADVYPSGDNSDAVKYQLRAVGSAIGSLRQSIREVGHLERPE